MSVAVALEHDETPANRAAILAGVAEVLRRAGYLVTMRTERGYVSTVGAGPALALRVWRRDVDGHALTLTVEDDAGHWWLRQLGATGGPVVGWVGAEATDPAAVRVWVRQRLGGNPAR